MRSYEQGTNIVPNPIEDFNGIIKIVSGQMTDVEDGTV